MTTSHDNQISKATISDRDTIEDIERKLTQDPDSPSLHYNLGLALTRSKQWEKSILEFRTAMKLRP